LQTSTLDCGVETRGGLAGLGSQGQGRATHPVAGGAIRPSYRAKFGRCCAVLDATALWCCLVCARVRRDDVCLKISPLEMAVLSVLAE
jgi:hypothetical protein